MTEKDFWEFLNSVLKKGRITHVSAITDSDNEELQAQGEFIGGQALFQGTCGSYYYSVPIFFSRVFTWGYIIITFKLLKPFIYTPPALRFSFAHIHYMRGDIRAVNVAIFNYVYFFCFRA